MPLSRSYDLTVVIVKDWRDPVQVILDNARKEEVVKEFETRVYDLTQTTVDELTSQSVTSTTVVEKYRPKLTAVAQDSEIDPEDEDFDPEDEDFDPELNGDGKSGGEEPVQPVGAVTGSAPVPKITSFSNDGVLTIVFSEKMKMPKLGDISRSKVALRLTKAVD